MKKRVSETKWIPFWGDKWLFGSMRIEFGVAERGVWIQGIHVDRARARSTDSAEV